MKLQKLKKGKMSIKTTKQKGHAQCMHKLVGIIALGRLLEKGQDHLPLMLDPLHGGVSLPPGRSAETNKPTNKQ